MIETIDVFFPGPDGVPLSAEQLATLTASVAALDTALDVEIVDRTDADATLTTAVNAKQPLDSDLTAVAALDSSTAGSIASDGAGWIKKTYAQFKIALGLVKGDVGLGNADNTSDTAKPVSTATQTALDAKIATTQKGAASGVAPLDAGSLIPSLYIPPIAITMPFAVASQAAMLALSAQRGDVAIRSDINKSFILSTDNPGTLADWLELRTPTDAVVSVQNRTGVVTLDDLFLLKTGGTITGALTIATTSDFIRADAPEGSNGVIRLLKAGVEKLAIHVLANQSTVRFRGSEDVYIEGGGGSNGDLVIKADGKVGINTIGPAEQLDVNGNAKVAGRILGVSTPTATTDAANKSYVDARATTLTVSGSTYTPNANTTTHGLITTPAADFTVAAPTGTPINGQSLTLRIRSDATGRVPTWNAAYVSSGVITLPTTALPASMTVTLGFTYDSFSSKWVLLAADLVGY